MIFYVSEVVTKLVVLAVSHLLLETSAFVGPRLLQSRLPGVSVESLGKSDYTVLDHLQRCCK